MRKVKCGIESAEWRWLVDPSNHVTTVIPHITAATAMTSQTDTNRGKMRNAENANMPKNEATMRSWPGTHVVKHFVDVFRPVHNSVKTLIGLCHVNYKNSELAYFITTYQQNICVLGYYRPAHLREKENEKGNFVVNKWVTPRGLHALFFARSPM